MISDIVWRVIFDEMTRYFEKRFDIILDIGGEILDEIETMMSQSLMICRLDDPNVAKVSGHIAFWIRKLKPINHARGSINKYLTINELVGLFVGLALCARFSESPVVKPTPRILHDWEVSLRYNSHSPQSTAMIFEIITNTK